MLHRWSVGAVGLVAFLITLLPFRITAAEERSFRPSVSLIVPGALVRDPALRDAVYQRLVHLAFTSYPSCTELRAYHRFTPQGSTAVVTVQCRARQSERASALPRA